MASFCKILWNGEQQKDISDDERRKRKSEGSRGGECRRRCRERRRGDCRCFRTRCPGRGDRILGGLGDRGGSRRGSRDRVRDLSSFQEAQVLSSVGLFTDPKKKAPAFVKRVSAPLCAKIRCCSIREPTRSPKE